MSELPVDGLVLIILHVHDNVDDYNIINTSSCMSSQETETDKIPVESGISRGPQQGGTTSSNLLIAKII